MRTQTGTSTLRAILYFDEIFGYLPPVSNPPSKQPMLRMLKQARAFGVGLVLVTQNPVDVDYKALSNAGTWMIGKLQTDQDKQRLLDGLESAMAGGMDRSQYDRLISTLGKRVFLLHNVHAKQPAALPDPLGDELPDRPADPHTDPGLEPAGRGTTWSRRLNPPHRPWINTRLCRSPPRPIPSRWLSPHCLQQASQLPPPASQGSATRPAVPTGVAEYFLPNNLTFTQAFEADGRTFPPRPSARACSTAR